MHAARPGTALLLALALVVSGPGCVGTGSGGGAAYPPTPAGPTFSTGGSGADLVLLAIIGLALLTRDYATSTAGGPNDEAGAARLRSAPIHAKDPFVGWP